MYMQNNLFYKRANSGFNNLKKTGGPMWYIYKYISTQNAYFLRLLLHRNNSLLFSGWEFRKGRFIAWTHQDDENGIMQTFRKRTQTVFSPQNFFFFRSTKVFATLWKYSLSVKHFYASNFSSDILSTTQDFGLESHPLVFHPAYVPNNS